MPISPAFSQAELPDATQKLLLVLLGVFLPPLPIYLLSGPKYTVWTKEFFVAVLLTLLFFFGGFLYTLYFVCVLFPESRSQPNGEGYFRIPEDLEHQSEPAAAPEACVPETVSSPPTYEESEGPSASREAPKDTKFTGDNKVQH